MLNYIDSYRFNHLGCRRATGDVNRVDNQGSTSFTKLPLKVAMNRTEFIVEGRRLPVDCDKASGKKESVCLPVCAI